MENIFAATPNFLGVEPVILLAGIAATLYMIYVIWEDREYALTWYGSVWWLISIPLLTLVFFLVLGALWRRFIHLDWYFDLAILAGLWVVYLIAALIWIAITASKLPDDPNRAATMRYMVQEPALEPAWNALKSGDDQDACKKLQCLADAGNPGAQHNLGIMYEAGLGIERSDSQAEFWYRKASDKGSREAQYQLGAILAADMMHGPVARQTDEQEFSERVLEGYMWLYLSALKKHKEAKAGVKRLKRIMSRDQMETAKRIAAQQLSNELRQKSN